MKNTVTWKEKSLWYDFKPSIRIWISKHKSKSHSFPIMEETYFGGNWFCAGYFSLIQCKKFSIHIKIVWWKFKFSK